MNRGSMFNAVLILIMQYAALSESILVERFCQSFIKISIPPSTSCKKLANVTQNLGNCFQSCMVYNGSSYMVSRNADTTECLCCPDVPTEDVYSSGYWNSYSFGKSETSFYILSCTYLFIFTNMIIIVIIIIIIIIMHQGKLF